MKITEDKRIKIKQIEDILYQWNFFVQTEKNFDSKIEELEAEVVEYREKLPQSIKENTISSNKISSMTENNALKVLEILDNKIVRLNNEKKAALKYFIPIRNTFNNLNGKDKELVRMKYFNKIRGKQLYNALNYSKSGFIYKKNVVLNYFLENIK